MFLAWDHELFDRQDKDCKSFWEAVYALEKFEPYAIQILSEWEVATFDGKPAVELSYKVDLQNGFYYRAYIDIVLKNKKTGHLLVLELKTTKSKEVHEALYKNSTQALGYSLVTDLIDQEHSSYYVWYLVYKSTERDFEHLPFMKSRLDKAKWIKSVLADCRRIQSFIDDQFFPMHGESCLDFYRPCQYFGFCEMSDKAIMAPQAILEARVEEELKEEFTFNFTLNDIINRQLELIK